MFDQGLIDMGFLGSKYTWTRGTHDHTFNGARLDRALCNVEQRNLFSIATFTHFSRIKYDHFPLLIKLHGDQNQEVHCPFRFQAT